MRAVVVTKYGGPEVLINRKVSIPKVERGGVLIRLLAAGVNPVDTYMREGSNGYRPNLPLIPGMAGAGIIEDVGEGVTGYEVGERVYTTGLGFGNLRRVLHLLAGSDFSRASETWMGGGGQSWRALFHGCEGPLHEGRYRGKRFCSDSWRQRRSRIGLSAATGRQGFACFWNRWFQGWDGLGFEKRGGGLF